MSACARTPLATDTTPFSTFFNVIVKTWLWLTSYGGSSVSFASVQRFSASLEEAEADAVPSAVTMPPLHVAFTVESPVSADLRSTEQLPFASVTQLFDCSVPGPDAFVKWTV